MHMITEAITSLKDRNANLQKEKMKRLSQVKTPEALKKNVSTTPGKTDGKMKRSSQVKTPERLKKTRAATPKKLKYLRSATSAPKKGKQ
ncbi:hypothetical protein RDI58_014317 [Solanum bulbocastanum]|uniref:Uncharacterized protein n=1 Tax=Solanum bulbocastanum TaxID=147425 RepID=A0AAN8TID5_SOLBU